MTILNYLYSHSARSRFRNSDSSAPLSRDSRVKEAVVKEAAKEVGKEEAKEVGNKVANKVANKGDRGPIRDCSSRVHNAV